MSHKKYMQMAIDLAEQAFKEGEAPVGCVVINALGEQIGAGYNKREQKKDATAHAEIEAISTACEKIGDWRLDGCSLYVTLEPCPMCAGAIIMSRIEKVFYGAREAKTGSCGSVLNLFMEPYGHKVGVTGGVMEKQCSELLSRFFRGIR